MVPVGCGRLGVPVQIGLSDDLELEGERAVEKMPHRLSGERSHRAGSAPGEDRR